MAYRGLLKYFSNTIAANGGSLPWTTLVDVTGQGVLGSVSTYYSSTTQSIEIVIDGVTVYSGTVDSLSKALGLPSSQFSTPLGHGDGSATQMILNLPFTTNLKVRVSASNGSTNNQTLYAAVRYLLVV